MYRSQIDLAEIDLRSVHGKPANIGSHNVIAFLQA